MKAKIEEIKDENGVELKIGMRVGCRDKPQPKRDSIRGCTLLGYDPTVKRAYFTDKGSFELALKDHQPDMDDFIKTHVN